MPENLVLEVARHHVRAYADTSAARADRELAAGSCDACAGLIQAGVDAYRWLRRADETLREADYCGLARLTPEIRETVGQLYALWLDAFSQTDAWIRSLGGSPPVGFAELVDACEEVREILDGLDWKRRATRARILSGSQEPW